MYERVTPTSDQIRNATAVLFKHLPSSGLALAATKAHLQNLIPGFNRSSQSPNYYGFVIGGALPAAAFADTIVTETDQNVGVHLPDDTVATTVEDRALRMLCELVNLDPDRFPHRIFTTGATASNVLGLTCGREYVVHQRLSRSGKDGEVSVAKMGLYEALLAIRAHASDNSNDFQGIRVLTTVPHSSLKKAASIAGIGHNNVVDVGKQDAPHKFDLERLELYLKSSENLSIVAVSCAEVNTGLFATTLKEMEAIRKLCDEYGGWIHVDAAFGLLARVLPASNPEYSLIRSGVAGLELADSITGDAHKLLNVPYDCGIFLSRHLQNAIAVFQNPNAAYLNSGGSSSDSVISPLNIGIENSRRFRALPVYAALLDQGKLGFQQMLERQIKLSRKIAALLEGSSSSSPYEVLPSLGPDDQHPATRLERIVASTYIIVLFRLRDPTLNRYLPEFISEVNSSGKIYISGTEFEGQPAGRFAIANWQADPERDIQVIREALEEVWDSFHTRPRTKEVTKS